VSFGTGYAGDDPIAFFEENLARYPAILPIGAGEEEAKFPCLRLHNGTIWRWNRPLVGFDDDGTPHLRIEHRVMPAGPSIVDMIANAALYYGAVFALAGNCRAPELPFEAARENFYAAAKHGLCAEIVWLGGKSRPVREVIDELIPLARLGLTARGVTGEVADRYLDVIASRNASGQNGAAWQLAHFDRHGDLFRLTADYLECQRSGMPVHEWPI
jgi:gamma-glutamyl:cysteine ligase YbdK (ATP-grasp superfamily)